MRSECKWAEVVKWHIPHQYSETVCFVKHEVEIRSYFRPRIKSVEEAYDEEGHIRSEFLGTDVEAVILPRYHRRAAEAAMNGSNGKLTPGLRQVLKLELTHNQLAHRYPWAVIVLRSGKRYRRRCTNIATAVHTQRELAQRFGNATIVSLCRGYDIPPKLRGKLPKGWFWCPHCMKPRKYKRVYKYNGETETFYGERKTWNDDKHYYEWLERELALLRCPVCLSTNRDNAFRRSNQPWEVRRVKPGVRRVKRRHRTKRKRRVR